MKGITLIFLFILLFVGFGYAQPVSFEKINKLCDDGQYIVAEKELIDLLKKYPIESSTSIDILKMRIAVLQRIGLFYGERGNDKLYERVYKAGRDCIERAKLSDEETACNFLNLITGYEYLVFAAADSAGYKQIMDSREKLLVHLDSKNKSHKTYLLKGKLDRAWKDMNKGELLAAKLGVMEVIQEAYMLNIVSKSCAEDTKWIESYARILMARICIKKKEYGMAVLYTERLLKLLPRSKTLLYTALISTVAELYVEVKDASDFRFYAHLLEDAVQETRSCMWPKFYKRQKKYERIRYNCSEWAANSLSHQVDISRQANWSKRLSEVNEELNGYIANGQNRLFVEKAREYYWDQLDYIANNYASYEQWVRYFDYCYVVSVNLLDKDPDAKSFINQMFVRSCEIIINVIYCASGISESHSWSDFNNRHHPYYCYSVEINEPFKDSAMTSISEYLSSLEQLNIDISPSAQRLNEILKDLKK